jgi:hypothetical protein
MQIYNKKFTFTKLPRSQIIVFDESHSDLIGKYILKDLPYTVYKMRPETLYVSGRLIIYFLLSIVYFDWSLLSEKNLKYPGSKGMRSSKIKAILREALKYYRLCCFKIIDPKIIITLIDNSFDLSWLSKHYKKGTFIVIQNGLRSNYELTKYKYKYYIQNYFCFGD